MTWTLCTLFDWRWSTDWLIWLVCNQQVETCLIRITIIVDFIDSKIFTMSHFFVLHTHKWIVHSQETTLFCFFYAAAATTYTRPINNFNSEERASSELNNSLLLFFLLSQVKSEDQAVIKLNWQKVLSLNFLIFLWKSSHFCFYALHSMSLVQESCWWTTREREREANADSRSFRLHLIFAFLLLLS